MFSDAEIEEGILEVTPNTLPKKSTIKTQMIIFQYYFFTNHIKNQKSKNQVNSRFPGPVVRYTDCRDFVVAIKDDN